MNDVENEKVLIICDSKTDFVSYCKLLNRNHLTDSTRHTSSAKEIPVQLESYNPDIIIIQYPCKAISRTDDVKYLALVAPEKPRIILSDIDTAESAVTCLQSGATDYLVRDKINQLPEVFSKAIFQKDTLVKNKIHALANNEIFLPWIIAVETANAGIWDWNISGNTVFYSRKWKELLGLKETDITNNLDEWKTRVHPDDMNSVMNALQKHVDGETGEYTSEHRLLTNAGNYIWVLDQGKVLFRDRFGKAIRMAGTFTDINSRKEAELKLREKDEKYNQLADTLPISIFETDCTGLITYVNRTGLAAFGYTDNELINKMNFVQCIVSEDQERIFRKFGQIVSEGIDSVGEYTALRKDGSTFSILVSSYNIVNDGVTIGVRGLAMDISKQKEAEAELLKNNTQLEEKITERTIKIEKLSGLNRAIVENIGIAVVSVSMDGKIEAFNPAAEQLLGYKAEEVLGTPSPFVFHDMEILKEKAINRGVISGEEQIPEFKSFMAQLIESLPQSIEWSLVKKNGQKVPVLLSLSLLYDGAGNIDGYVGVAIDITERKKAEEAIIASEQRFHNMFQNHDAMMFLVDPDSGTVVDANKSACEFYGYDFDSGIKISSINTLHPSELHSKMKDAVDQKHNYFTFYHRLANGEIRAVDIHSTPIEFNNQRLLFSIIRDVTDKKLAEESLRTTSLMLKTLISNMQSGILFEDSNRKLVLINQAFCDTFYVKAKPEELIGVDCGEATIEGSVIMKDPEGFVKSTLQMLQDKKIVVSDEVEFAKGYYYERDYIPILENNELIGHLWQSHNITARKKAQEALRRNESLLRLMANSSPLAFYVVDNRTDEILYFNHRFCEIWGITHLEERMKLGEIRNNDTIPDCIKVLTDIEAFAESCKPLQDENNRITFEDFIPFNDGRTIRRFSTQIRGDNDEYYGRFYIFEDVTEQKQAEYFLSLQRDLGIGLSAVSNMQETLNLSIDALIQTKIASCGGIYLLNHKTGNLELVITRNLSEEFIKQTSIYTPDTAQFQLVLKGDSVFGMYTDLLKTTDACLCPDKINAISVIPIHNEGKVFGSLNLGSTYLTEFPIEIRHILEGFANQIGIAIARIQAEESLIASQQNFLQMFDTLDDFMFILDAEGLIIKTNPVVQHRLGYTEEELIGKHVLAVHPPERRDEAGFIVNEMLSGRALYCPVPLIAKDGTQIPVETRVIMGKWDNEPALYGISRDITERIKTQQSLFESEEIFNQFMLNSPIHVFFKDSETRPIRLSRNFEELIGRPLNEVLGKTMYELFPSEFAKKLIEDDLNVLKSGKKIELTEILNGRYYHTTKFPIKVGGKTTFLAGFSIDITEKLKAEKDLQLRESYLSAVINNHPGMFWLKDTYGKFILVNEKNDRYLKYNNIGDTKTVIGKTDFDYLPEEDAIKYKEEDIEIITTLHPIVREEHYKTTKEEVWYEKFKFPVIDSNGKVIGVGGYTIDITMRKRSEVQLRMQNAAFNSFALAMMITDQNELIQWINPAFTKLTGYESAEIIGRKPSFLNSGQNDEKFYKSLINTIRTGNVWSGEIINKRKDGSQYYEEETITPVLGENSEIINYIAIKIDISHRKEIEEALRQSEQRWQVALEGSGDGIWDWDASTNEVFFSTQWKSMLGYEPEDIGNALSEWSNRVHPDDLDECMEALQKHFKGENSIYISEHRMLCKNGEYKWVLDRGKVIAWQSVGVPKRVIGTHSDISTQKALEDTLKKGMERERELNDLKSRFVSTASHEFRTPLASILIISESLTSYWKKMTEDQISARLGTVKEQVLHLTEIVNNVLQLSKIQEGKTEVNLEMMDLVELSRSIVGNFNSNHHLLNKIVFDCREKTITLLLDNRLIKQAIDNLLSNAIKYTPENPNIIFKISKTKTHFLISVSDNGIGIPEEEQKHLFTPFFRATNTKLISGNGLGLNIVRDSIILIGGDVTFHSQPGKGSEFFISFARNRNKALESHQELTN